MAGYNRIAYMTGIRNYHWARDNGYSGPGAYARMMADTWQLTPRQKEIERWLESIQKLLPRAYPDAEKRRKATFGLYNCILWHKDRLHAARYACRVLHMKTEPQLQRSRRARSIIDWACRQLGYSEKRHELILESIMRPCIPDTMRAVMEYWEWVAERLLRRVYRQCPDAPVIPYAERLGIK